MSSEVTAAVKTPAKKLDLKDVKSAFWRWFFGAQIAWNYETMQSGGVVLSLGPALRKIHPDDGMFKRSLDEHFAFFNTNPWTGTIALGATLAVEEQFDPEEPEVSREAVTSIKTALMGPLAGIGDAIVFVIPMTITGAIAAYMAQQGSWLGILFPITYALLMVFARRWMFLMGYLQGSKFVTTLSHQFRSLADAAGALGVMVVGALISSVVTVHIPMVFSQGQAKVELQSTLDMIMPNLVPALLTGLVYWLLGKKWMNSTRAILLIVVVAFLGYFIGLFGTTS